MRCRPPRSRLLCALLGLATLVALALAAPTDAGEKGADAALKQVPIAESLRPMDPWLRNADWTVRSMAVLELKSRPEAGAVFFATRLLVGEAHPYAIACALQALRGRPRIDLVLEGGVALVDVLFRLLDHAHPTVKQRAFDLLKTIPPVKLGVKREMYEGWWKRGREALRLEQESMLAKVRAAGPPKTSGDGGTVEAATKDDDLYEHLERIRVHGLELAIVMDHTGSMAPVIGEAKRRAVSLVKRLQSFLPKFRAGLVTYDDSAMLRMPLTTNAETLLKAFNKVGAGGGGDFEEGVDKGIRLAMRQELLGWSRSAQRVIVVVGDAPPHDPDVARMLREIQKGRGDELYDLPLLVHTVSTNPQGVEHFSRIARVGGGAHITLRQTSRLVDELILLSFGGGAHRARVMRWIAEIEALQKAASR
ncbi:MAG: VWA domain-containing protein [Planctomycetota bacterium]|nr:VWA domain-containing protein [Planctomycetota bacterium]